MQKAYQPHEANRLCGEIRDWSFNLIFQIDNKIQSLKDCFCLEDYSSFSVMTTTDDFPRELFFTTSLMHSSFSMRISCKNSTVPGTEEISIHLSFLLHAIRTGKFAFVVICHLSAFLHRAFFLLSRVSRW